MDELSTKITKITKIYQFIFAVAFALSFGNMFSTESVRAIDLVLFLGFSIATYYLGSYLLQLSIAFFLGPKIFAVLEQQERLRRIAENDFKDSAELETILAQSGLQPLTIVVETGPVFGSCGENQLFEWIDARAGSAGEVLRYTYHETATFDDDGFSNAPDAIHRYITVDGSLYKHEAEPRNI